MDQPKKRWSEGPPYEKEKLQGRAISPKDLEVTEWDGRSRRKKKRGA